MRNTLQLGCLFRSIRHDNRFRVEAGKLMERALNGAISGNDVASYRGSNWRAIGMHQDDGGCAAYSCV